MFWIFVAAYWIWSGLEASRGYLNVWEIKTGLHMTKSAKQVIELKDENASMKTDVQALERISKADGSLCVTDTAKALQMRPTDLFNWLRQNGWIYKRTGSANYIGYQSKVVSGLLEHKVTTITRPDGTEKVTEQVRITPKGLKTLAKLIQPALQEVA